MEKKTSFGGSQPTLRTAFGLGVGQAAAPPRAFETIMPARRAELRPAILWQVAEHQHAAAARGQVGQGRVWLWVLP